jgi:putative transposase
MSTDLMCPPYPGRSSSWFLAVILDVFPRRVVGWSMSSPPERHACDGGPADGHATTPAAKRRGSSLGQGCQNTRYDFERACGVAGTERSMRSVGDCYEVMAKSFLATLEFELIDRSVFENRNQARMAVFAFIEGFDNT